MHKHKKSKTKTQKQLIILKKLFWLLWSRPHAPNSVGKFTPVSTAQESLSLSILQVYAPQNKDLNYYPSSILIQLWNKKSWCPLLPRSNMKLQVSLHVIQWHNNSGKEQTQWSWEGTKIVDILTSNSFPLTITWQASKIVSIGHLSVHFTNGKKRAQCKRLS